VTLTRPIDLLAEPPLAGLLDVTSVCAFATAAAQIAAAHAISRVTSRRIRIVLLSHFAAMNRAGTPARFSFIRSAP
jgi:hypothetical protein